MDEGLELLDPSDLYNLLQQSSIFSNLSDPNYLLLIGEKNIYVYLDENLLLFSFVYISETVKI